ncbi:GNAT family N-acetyltransferase [Kitasatospora sp. NPDC048540]|uniref:GNAT family N-acetyltransferase n=1 Tax=unclassified Kitasatospora TaxID=2633591 RepID=UPI000691E897|nr:GNAT family N-acetyltransferase [Kitasatospora sp. MBT63]
MDTLTTHPARTPSQRIRFLPLPAPALTALLAGDLAGAGALVGTALDPYFLTEQARWLWGYRLAQLAERPQDAPWLVRVAVDRADGAVVGYAGFHGAPDGAGMVEVGYSVLPAARRRGYATAILAELLRLAATEPAVETVRATVSPDNTGSLAVVRRFGFAEVGEQWDERDGLEIVFERPARDDGDDEGEGEDPAE